MAICRLFLLDVWATRDWAMSSHVASVQTTSPACLQVLRETGATGLEPATSRVTVLSSAGQAWSAHVGSGWLCGLRLIHVSGVGDNGQPDLTRI